MAVAGNVMAHLKQGEGSTREGRRGVAPTQHEKKCRDLGLEGLEVAPDMEHNVDLEVINGAGGRISG